MTTNAKTPSLKIGGKQTVAAQKLAQGLTETGAQIVRRGKGWTDYDVIRRLVRHGWLEEKQTGPRGGTRYFTTDAGKNALGIEV